MTTTADKLRELARSDEFNNTEQKKFLDTAASQLERAEDEAIRKTKLAPLEYQTVHQAARRVIGYPDRNYALIGVDGFPGSGKSHLASWLSWQLNCPAHHLDDFRWNTKGYEIDANYLRRLIDKRKTEDRPVILDGIKLLDCAELIDLPLSLHIWAQIDGDQFSDYNQQVFDYVLRRRAQNIEPDVICRLAAECHPSGRYDRSWHVSQNPIDQD